MKAKSHKIDDKHTDRKNCSIQFEISDFFSHFYRTTKSHVGNFSNIAKEAVYGDDDKKMTLFDGKTICVLLSDTVQILWSFISSRLDQMGLVFLSKVFPINWIQIYEIIFRRLFLVSANLYSSLQGEFEKDVCLCYEVDKF